MSIEKRVFFSSVPKNLELFGKAEVLASPMVGKENIGYLRLNLEIKEMKKNQILNSYKIGERINHNLELNKTTTDKIEMMHSEVLPILQNLLKSKNLYIAAVDKMDVNPQEGRYYWLRGALYKKSKKSFFKNSFISYIKANLPFT